MPGTNVHFTVAPSVRDDGVEIITNPDAYDFKGNGVSVVANDRVAEITINGGVEVQEGGSSILNPALAINFDSGDFGVSDEGSSVAGVLSKTPFDRRMLSTLEQSGFGVYQPFYSWGCHSLLGAGTAASLAANQMLFQQDMFQRNITVDRILISRNIGGAPAAKFKFAIYSSVSSSNLHPYTREAVSGEITAQLAQYNPGTLYVYVWDLSAYPFTFLKGVVYHIGLVCDASATTFSAPSFECVKQIIGMGFDSGAPTPYTGLATAVTGGLYAGGFPATYDEAAVPLLAGAYNVFNIGYRPTTIT